MTRTIMVGGGNRLGKSVMVREVTEAARELGYEIVEVPPGATGRTVDNVWLDELADLQDMPPHKRPEEIPAPWSPNNRKARRAQAAERRRSK